MIKTEKTTAYLQIHIAVLLFGVTAILGKLIVFDGLALVWHRMWISVIGLVLLPGVVRGIRNMPRKDFLRFAGIGVIVSLHWLTFYGSIKLGDSASIPLACLATSTIFTSFLEPLITKSKFQAIESLLGVLVVFGILLILNVGAAYHLAIGVGLLSAFLAALFSVLNKQYMGNHRTLSITSIELFSGFVFLSIVILVYEGGFNLENYSLFRDDLISKHALAGYYIHSFWYLLILGILCTSVAYALSLYALKILSAFTTNLAINLEPIYGMLMAVVLFQENDQLTPSFYWGSALILCSVILHPFLMKITDKRVKAKIIREA